MDWNDLRYFLAVARAGQVSSAASVLKVDPTTVSRRVRRLEALLQQRLFEQTREGQTLTEAGQRLLLRAEEIDRNFTDLGPSPRMALVSGLLRVSVSEGFGTWFMAPALKEFVDQYSDVQLDLVANSGFLSPSRREADVAILLARPRKGPLISRKLSDYVLRLYVSRHYLDRVGAIEGASALKDHPLIGYIPDFIYAPELRYLDEIAQDVGLKFRSSSIIAQYRLAASGAGIAALPCFIGDADPALVRIMPGIAIRRTFWIVTHQDTRRLARVEAFVDWLTALVERRRGLLLGEEAVAPG